MAIDLDFTAIRTPAVARESQHDLARFLRGARPSAPCPPSRSHVVGEPLEVDVEVLQRGLLDRARPVPQRLALREAREGLLARDR